MLQILLFFIVGVALVVFLLAPFAKRLETMEKRIQDKEIEIRKEMEKELVPDKRKKESMLDQLTTQHKEQTEIDREKEEEMLKLEVQGNARGAFRVKLSHILCEFVLNSRAIKGKGKIMDISTTGMKIQTDRDIVFQPNISMRITFAFEGTTYSFKGVPLRKDKVSASRYEYGIVFAHESKEQIKSLHRALWEIQRKRGRSII